LSSYHFRLFEETSPHSRAGKAVMSQKDYETYKLGDWELQSGEKIVDAHIAFKTFGDPNSPAILYPSWFSGCEF